MSKIKEYLNEYSDRKPTDGNRAGKASKPDTKNMVEDIKKIFSNFGISDEIDDIISPALDVLTNSMNELAAAAKKTKPAVSNEYDYVEQPPHYLVFTPEEVQSLAAAGRGIDADMIARQRGLEKDTYMYMINKYTLRENKPNEPRARDVKKIKRYAEMWIEAHAGDEG